MGISLALLLARMLPGKDITLVEAFPVRQADSYTPSFDGRSTALSESSRQVFQHLGLWSDLAKHSTAITQIHVSDRGHLGSTRLRAEEQGLPALGYVVENSWFGNVLLDSLLKTQSIKTLAPAKVTAVAPTQTGMALTLTGSDAQLQTDLLVVADGANSETCAMLGIESTRGACGQMGLTANVELSQHHRNIAYERFTGRGPMALLPLQTLPLEMPAGEEQQLDSGAKQFRAALVWTLPEQRAAELMACPEGDFLMALQARFGHRGGEFIGVGKRHAYPLQLVTANEQVRRNLVVVGNAAHSLHPVAGQGFNLALRDCASLAGVFAEAVSAGESCGDLSVLQQYQQAQQADQRRTILFSDLLPKAFSFKNPPLALARNLSLLAMDSSAGLRGSFANLGMGLLGKNPLSKNKVSKNKVSRNQVSGNKGTPE